MSASGIDIRQSGVITEIKRGVVKLSGLPTCIMGQLLELTAGVQGFVIGFTDKEVLALTLGREADLSVGQTVSVRQQPLRIPVSEELLGRVVSPLVEPMDGLPALPSPTLRALFCEAPGIMMRSPVERQLCTGTSVIDAMIPLGKGQRELIIGDRMTGKTALALDTVLSQRESGVVCIYCAIGQSQQKLRQVIQLLSEQKALPYSLVVAASASQQASEQFLAPFAAATLGEYFMAQGRDVVVIFDDLSKHAWAYRQLSLLLERPPGREAYPGDMFYIHAQLMERAGQLSSEKGGGSMTFLPICETQQGDVTGYISSNLISMTDGQLYLSSELFYEGIKPAIDVGLSVSRIGNKVQSPLLRESSGSLRLELLQHRELIRLNRFSAARSEEALRRQERGNLIRRLIAQQEHRPRTLADQTLFLYALKMGLLKRVNEEGLQLCLLGLSKHLSQAMLAIVQETQPPTAFMRAQLEDALTQILQPYLTQTSGDKHAVAEIPAG